MSKIHYLLIFLIFSTLGVSFWLLMDNDPDPVPEKKIVVTQKEKPKKLANGYVQGVLEVPDLTAGFRRCLNRGYSDVQKEVLEEAMAYFSMREFSSGEFVWNKVVATNDFGESFEYHLTNSDAGLELSIFERENGKTTELLEKKASSLIELKELLSEFEINSNEYAQVFRDRDMTMTLILSKGIMKTLKIVSPKKSVTCKP